MKFVNFEIMFDYGINERDQFYFFMSVAGRSWSFGEAGGGNRRMASSKLTRLLNVFVYCVELANFNNVNSLN